MTHRFLCVLVLALVISAPAGATGFEAGVARVTITPEGAFWMSGYAAREAPSQGVLQELEAKALAVRDQQGHRVVFVTVDLIGLSRVIALDVAKKAKERFGLDRRHLVLNASHTHSGPMIWQNLPTLLRLGESDQRKVEAYGRGLVDTLVDLIGAALRDLSPAALRTGHGSVGFAVNRRLSTPEGYRIRPNPDGPVDHDVPVVQVTAPDGTLRAILFGYACHNTTLGGDILEINGDYAGWAQAEIERVHPGATALFLMLCGGDQNPHPSGTVDLAKEHGASLAREVARVLRSPLQAVSPPIRTAFVETRLDFPPHDRQAFEVEATGPDEYRQRRALLMLEAYDTGRPVRDTPFPVQAVRFDDDLTLVALGGEVVVDYVLRAKREYANENLVMAGYSHDVMCYIPSLRVLREGGYEANQSMVYYGQPGPFAETVEEQVFDAVRTVLTSVGVPAPRPD